MKLLREVEVGTTISYKELSDSIKRDVQHLARGNLNTARWRLMKDEGIVFGTVIKEGCRRLDDEGIVATGAQDVQRIRKISKRAIQRLAQVQNFGSLPTEKQKEHLVLSAQFGMIAHAGKDRVQKKLIAKTDPAKLIPSVELLKRLQETL